MSKSSVVTTVGLSLGIHTDSLLCSLKRRLVQSGFNEDIINHIPRHDWRQYPTMGQAKPLTDGGEQSHSQQRSRRSSRGLKMKYGKKSKAQSKKNSEHAWQGSTRFR